MACRSCQSAEQRSFPAEVNVHLPGISNVDKPPFFIFPQLLVCLACGSVEFAMTDDQLGKLKDHSDSQPGGG